MVIKIQYTAHNRDKLNFLLRQTIMAKRYAAIISGALR